MLTGNLPPVSRHADWPDSHAFEIYDDTNGAAIDLTTASEITLTITDPANGCDVMSAALTSGGIALQGTATFTPTAWTAAKMAALCNETYQIRCEAVVSGKTVALLDGSLPVI